MCMKKVLIVLVFLNAAVVHAAPIGERDLFQRLDSQRLNYCFPGVLFTNDSAHIPVNASGTPPGISELLDNTSPPSTPLDEFFEEPFFTLLRVDENQNQLAHNDLVACQDVGMVSAFANAASLLQGRGTDNKKTNKGKANGVRDTRSSRQSTRLQCKPSVNYRALHEGAARGATPKS